MPIGGTIGAYQVIAKLGVGGMGEVYRARDSKLNRDVAIKVLLPAVANDPDRLARFSREAQVLASLNHPNIAAIYGLEEIPGDVASGLSRTSALVMELVEGEDLSQRISHGPVPIDEALPIARQIAEALEAAHDHGIIHRDLKPANIKVRPDGTVKVLDFGLAKAIDPTSGSSATAVNSPTLSIHATQAGIVLGTAAYMSPEQARGKSVDRRTDIWAFGAILFEMLSGRRPFEGDTITDVIAAVVTREPDWPLLPAAASAGLRRLLRRCLTKDPRERLQAIGDARLDIDEILSQADDPAAVTQGPRRSIAQRVLPWAAAAAALMIAGAFAWPRAVVPMTPVYASLAAPADYNLGEFRDVPPTRAPMVFTPDGRSLILLATRAGQSQLFLRQLDRPDALPIAGSDGARVPFVSPDGRWVGLWAANELRKVPIEGGAATTICALPGLLGPYGASWGADDTIVFGDPVSRRIMRVPAGGGTPVAVTAPPPPFGTARRHVTPTWLPGGDRILYADVGIRDPADTRLMVQSLAGGDARQVLTSATDARLLPTGHLAFMRLGTLMAVAFDVARAEAIGEPVVALDGVMQSGLRGFSDTTGAGMVAASSLGDLAVVRGGLIGYIANSLIWVAHDGQSSSAEPASGAPADGRITSRVSPNGSRALVGVQTPTRREVWIADWARNVWTACRGCNSERGSGEWSADGLRLLFGGPGKLTAHTLDQSAPDQVLLQEADRYLLPTDWLPDGRIVYLSTADQVNFDIKFVEPGGSIGRVVVEAGSEAAVSPDGRWLAYHSKGEVIVQAFPGPGARTVVSAGRASNPAWSPDGRTLYYLQPVNPGSAIVAVNINTASGLTAGTPRELFRHFPDQVCANIRCYDLSSDGRRFLFRERTAAQTPAVTGMDLVLNWTSTLPRHP